ncbi:transcription initiation factor IIA subunit 1 isoform X2 [Scomber japonicus]|uniref:transcription initiation factor IIA subunit 1 isoform X2 n=1 Tax=Scomber japonicus TaxID=13676 RepID=UPI002305A4EB|nr:transcription initiation factor IIA subunit 1 isoform X2 [Scomber japonicus]
MTLPYVSRTRSSIAQYIKQDNDGRRTAGESQPGIPKLYKSVIEDVINEVRELFLDEGVDEQVLLELKTLWENKLLQSKAVEGFHTEEQAALQAAQQQQQQQQQQVQPVQQVQQVTQQAQAQQVILPPQQQQAPQQQVIVQDSKILQHMSATGMSAAATAATLALPTGVSPYQQLITSQGQILQVVRAPNGAQYIIQQPQQQILLQQQMQPGGVQAPVIQQVLAPLQGGLPQQTGVIIQPQQIVLAGNKVQGGTQVMQAAMAPQPGQAATAAQVQQVQQAQGAAAPQAQQQPQAQQAQAQPQAQQPPMMLQVDGAGDTSSEEDEDEEEEYDDEEEEEKDKDGGEDGQVEEEPLNSGDDVSDEEDQELFDTENVVVCQYDKIHRSKNKWKFHLKDGIMNLNGRDYVFSKAIGDAEW